MRETESSDVEGRHICLLYRDENDQKRYVLPFLQDGLNNGEHCLFICPEDTADDWSLEFQAFGIDVVGHRESGALVIATGEQWRRNSFRSLAKARELWQHIDMSLVDFPAVRIAGDASWAMIEPQVTSDRLCHWEATADVLYEGLPVRCICMYDMRLLAPSDVRAALRTHSWVALDQVTHANPFYEAPRILEREPALNNSDADPGTIDAMLAYFRNAGRNPGLR
jgi:hypothetical protein